MASNHQQESIGRRTFVKWAGALGGSAALASSPLLRHVEPSFADTTDDGGFVGNTSAALELGPTGLPYGADKVVPTLCTCGDVCGMLHMGQAYVKDGKIVYYEGCDAAENHGKLCPRGMSGMSVINSPNRIKYPMRRTNEKGVEGEFERISWDEAYDILTDAIVEAIEEEGPHTCSLASYHQGNFMVGGEYAAFCKIWGMDATYGPGGCFSDLQIGEQATMGDSYHTLLEDPYESEVILIWGENDAVAKPTEWSESYWKGIREHGAKFIHVEPRMSEMGEKADLFLPVRPGTDAYLALAMCNVIITEGLQDQEFIDRYTYGYDEFKELVERYTPEEVEKICWTPADRIREAARLYAGTKKALLCVGRGGNQTGGDRSNSGWLASRAILCLIGLTGNVGQKGNGFSTEASLQPSSCLYWHWPCTMVAFAPSGPATPLVERDPQFTQGGTWGGAKRLINREPYGYRVYMCSHNPASSTGNAAQMDEALKKIPMVVVLNRLAHWTGSAYADLLIPICSWAEMYNWRLDWQEQVITEPAIEPLFESKSDFTFLKELSYKLAEKMGLDTAQSWPWADEQEYLKMFINNDTLAAEIDRRVAEGREEFAEWKDCTVQKMIDTPMGMPNPFYAGLDDFVPFKAKDYPAQAPADMDPEELFFPTAAGGDYPGDGKILFRCDWLAERSGGVLPVMPVPEEPYDSWYAEGNPIESGNWEPSQAVKDGFDLVACGKGHRHWQFISFNQDKDGGPASRWLREAFQTASAPCVEMNPTDAAERGLADGDLVTVESLYGKQEGVQLIVTERCMPRTIVPPCHWGKQQNAIYPWAQSLDQLDEQYKTSLNPGAVGEWGLVTTSIGGQNVQSAVLCKVYAYEG